MIIMPVGSFLMLAGRPNVLGSNVDTFFLNLYFSMGETRPHGCRPSQLIGRSFMLASTCGTKMGYGMVRLVGGGLAHPQLDTRQLQEDLITAIMDTYTQIPTNLVAKKLETLVVRYLPPGRVVDLYSLYRSVAVANGDPVASIAWFRKIWHSKWKKVLRFRRSSTHAMCETCHKLKSQIRHSKGMLEHIAASTELLNHLRAQWADRGVYWRCRSLARDPTTSVLCLVVDGMDRQKF